VNFKTVIGTI